jgi:hypothetical protein
MTDIGKFRAVDVKDKREFAYGGDSKLLEADLANLRRQGLIVEWEIPHQETAPRQLVALTKQGHRLLSATKSASKDQALYRGFTKPREAHHDADLYRLYQRGLEKIARQGGTNVRVILDSELKKNLYRGSGRANQTFSQSGNSQTRTIEHTVPQRSEFVCQIRMVAGGS